MRIIGVIYNQKITQSAVESEVQHERKGKNGVLQGTGQKSKENCEADGDDPHHRNGDGKGD